METTEIADGVKVHVIPTKKFKSVCISILLRQPLTRATATANALIPQVLQRGSSKYRTTAQVCGKAESLFGSLFEVQVIKKGEQQIIQFFMEYTPGDDGEKMRRECLEFLKEMMLTPLVENGGFKKEYVEGEKEILRLGIESRMNNRAEYAKLRLIEHMCEGEPFGVYGDGYVNDIDGLTPQGILRRYENMLREAPIDFIAAGNLNAEAFTSDIEKIFTFERGRTGHIPPPLIMPAWGDVRQKEEQLNLTQGKICAGFRSGVDPIGSGYFGLLMANEISGGGAASRLFNIVRERENLCYYINSFIYRFKTIAVMQSGVDTANFDRVLELAVCELEKMAGGQITDSELNDARKSLVKKFEGAKDYPSALMDFHISQYMLGDGGALDDVIDAVNRVTKEDAAEAAGKLGLDTIYRLY